LETIVVIPSEKLTIETPEHVSLEFNLAGLGSRFMATLADTLIQVVFYVLLVLLYVVLMPNLHTYWELAGKWTYAAFVFIFFLLYWGYYAIFESLWKGQTPGKRWARIRVIKNSGRPITPFEAISRNFIRVVDSFPLPSYAIGMIVMFLSRRNCRLGDMVAGTVVVHEAATETTAPLWGNVDANQPAKFDVSRLTVNELETIETFLNRKLDLDPQVRQAMAEKLSSHIAMKMLLPPYAVGYGQGQWRPEHFLEQIALDLRAVSRYR
jgi:uncharacterized RDD family membrane protein YckC